MADQWLARTDHPVVMQERGPSAIAAVGTHACQSDEGRDVPDDWPTALDHWRAAIAGLAGFDNLIPALEMPGSVPRVSR